LHKILLQTKSHEEILAFLIICKPDQCLYHFAAKLSIRHKHAFWRLDVLLLLNRFNDGSHNEIWIDVCVKIVRIHFIYRLLDGLI
jgi:hypothetical protein